MTGVVDFAWEVERLIVELDGRRWHAVSSAQTTDRRRDRVANAHGWIVVRFGWQELVERPEQVAQEVRWMLASRAKQVWCRSWPEVRAIRDRTGEMGGGEGGGL